MMTNNAKTELRASALKHKFRINHPMPGHSQVVSIRSQDISFTYLFYY